MPARASAAIDRPVACAASAVSIPGAARVWKLRSGKAQIAAGRSARLRLGSSKALRRAARSAQRRFPKRKLSVVVTVRVRAADGKLAQQKLRVPVRLPGQ